MALRFLDSFDHYQTADLLTKWTQGTGSVAIAPGAGRCGGAALHMPGGSDLYRGIPFASNTVTIGCAFRLASAGTTSGRDFTFLVFNNASGTGFLASLQSNANGSLTVNAGLGSAVLGTTVGNVIHQDVWYYLEWRMVFHATAGATTVRVNGVVQLDLTGVNTLVGGVPLPPAMIYIRSNTFGGVQSYYLDDLYVLDDVGPAPGNTFLGDCRVEYLRPRAAGALQQWTVLGAGSHWQAVDDNATPDQDATCVEATAAGLTDTNRYTPTGLPVGPILGAQLSLSASKTQIGPRTIAPVVNGVTGAPVAPSQTSYAYFSSVYPTNPATGLPWTITEINAVECGVTVVS